MTGNQLLKILKLLDVSLEDIARTLHVPTRTATKWTEFGEDGLGAPLSTAIHEAMEVIIG